MEEIWKPIIGFERYKISNYGRVMNTIGTISHQGDNGKGYKNVTLYYGHDIRKRIKVHRLVAIHFLDNSNNLPMVNHIDGNKSNNNVENLEWCTASYNSKHSFKLGLQSTAGQNHPQTKLKNSDVYEIRALSLKWTGFKIDLIADMYQMSASGARKIKNRSSWGHI